MVECFIALYNKLYLYRLYPPADDSYQNPLRWTRTGRDAQIKVSLHELPGFIWFIYS